MTSANSSSHFVPIAPGFYTLEVGGFFAIVTLFWWNDAAVIANGVFFAIVLAEAVRAGFQFVDYHRCVA